MGMNKRWKVARFGIRRWICCPCPTNTSHFLTTYLLENSTVSAFFLFFDFILALPHETEAYQIPQKTHNYYREDIGTNTMQFRGLDEETYLVFVLL